MDTRIETPILYWWEWRAQSATVWAELDPAAPPQLHTQTLLRLRMRFHNYGSRTKYVLPWMNVTPPSGNIFGVGPVGEVKTEVPAGEDRHYTFDAVALNEVGVWQAMFFVAEADTPDAIPVMEDGHTDLMPVAVATAAPVDEEPPPVYEEPPSRIWPVVAAIGIGTLLVGAIALATRKGQS